MDQSRVTVRRYYKYTIFWTLQNHWKACGIRILYVLINHFKVVNRILGMSLYWWCVNAFALMFTLSTVNKLYVHVCVLAKHNFFALPNPLSCSVMNKICLNQQAFQNQSSQSRWWSSWTDGYIVSKLHVQYTPKAVVIDNHLPRQPLISSYVPDWPLPPRVYIPSESEMALRARIYAYNRHLSFDVAFICAIAVLWRTVARAGICHLSVWRLKWEVSYVHQSVWRWKWFFCQSNYVLQRLRLCRTSDTVFRREIDSLRQWGYGTCYGGIVSPTAKECICPSTGPLSQGWNTLVLSGGKAYISWECAELWEMAEKYLTQKHKNPLRFSN